MPVRVLQVAIHASGIPFQLTVNGCKAINFNAFDAILFTRCDIKITM
jgi:hypothetical protein